MNAPAPRLIPLSPELSVAGRLDAADIDALARAGVRTIVNNRPDGEDPGQLPAAEARRLAEARGLQYRHIPITAASLSRADVESFAAALKTAPGPIVAHCRSGTRSALLWALVRLGEGADPFTLVAEAARNGIDIASLPAVAARLR
ncbi:MAG TPA: TIGR01244 family sulfur transferase [Stellaceae bacterium]|nr:TIGR01244 family sulfur transferase [Stellaceae bacterium]